MNVLLCEEDTFNPNDLNIYTNIFVMGKAPLENEKVVSIPLYPYFMKAHSTARVINKILLAKSSLKVELHFSILKLADLTIFNNARVVEVLKELPHCDSVRIKIKEPNYLGPILNLLGLNSENIVITPKKKSLGNMKVIKKAFKLLTLIYNSFKTKEHKVKSVFFMYNDRIAFEFAKPYLKNCITFPFLSPELNQINNKYGQSNYLERKFICVQQLFFGASNFIKNNRAVRSSSTPIAFQTLYIDQLAELEINSMMVLSLKNKVPKLTNVLGLFDAYSCIDYVTLNLNKRYNIRTTCIPHGINFKYKVDYISYGVNTYTFWGENHYKRMEESNLQQKANVTKSITGNVIYKNTFSEVVTSAPNHKKRILVVGEYFSKDNFYSSPFNVDCAKVFFDVLTNFVSEHLDINLIIRTRLNDDYSKLARSYISERVTLSSPDKSMIEELNESDLVITIFSNALHEALLLKKEVLQVNLLEVENYRDLAKDELVYYADTKSEFSLQLERWNTSRLPKLDFNKHLIQYCNNSLFTPINIKESK